jgi:hypothetical protein
MEITMIITNQRQLDNFLYGIAKESKEPFVSIEIQCDDEISLRNIPDYVVVEVVGKSRVHFESSQYKRITATDSASLTLKGKAAATLRKNAKVKACDDTFIYSFDESSVMAYDNSYIFARDKSGVYAHDKTKVILYDEAVLYDSGCSTDEIIVRFNGGKVFVTGNTKIINDMKLPLVSG